MVTLADIEEAMDRIAAVLRPTPVAPAGSLSRLAGRRVLVKPEHLQRTGSFKLRGAYNLISRLAPPAGPGVAEAAGRARAGTAGAGREPAGRPAVGTVTEVVAASAGNHAQGVALAATLCRLSSTVFMPFGASLPKVDATRAYGASVHLVGETVEDAMVAAAAHAEATGAVLIPPFDHPLVIAGQGTLGLEVATEAPEVEVVVVPAGGGGLLSGVATALAHLRPDVRVVGVEAAGAASVRASVDAGRPVVLRNLATMADGIAVRGPSELTLAHIQAYVDDMVAVSEEEITRAIVLLLERSKAVVEPAGAVALAAILAGKVPGTGPALAVLSGGNVDPLLLVRLIDHGLSAAGRYLLVRVVLDDRPGALAALSAAVAAMHLNVLSVEHHRAGLGLAVDQVEVLLTVETRGPDHRLQVAADLADAGFAVQAVG